MLKKPLKVSLKVFSQVVTVCRRIFCLVCPLCGLQDEGDGRVGGTLVFDKFTVQPDTHECFMVLEVKDNHGDFAVGVEGGGGDEVVAVGSADDAFGAGTDESGELAQNIVWRIV